MTEWTAVVPVKRFALAKQRLLLPDRVRADLAQAFARDVLHVVSETFGIRHIVLVSSERSMARAGQRCGAHVLSDPVGRGPDGLNLAIARGVEWAERHHPDDAVVVVPADLPCLTAEALADVLSAAEPHDRAIVTDSQKTGTALLLARDAATMTPSFGTDSAVRHRQLGHRDLEPAPRVVRRDVDTLEHLAEAVDLGVGGYTFSALWRHRMIPLGSASPGARLLDRVTS
ncbi:MAG: 2-phospho-L-lactate guanylyltransferase [Aeromicrobium sp.]